MRMRLRKRQIASAIAIGAVAAVILAIIIVVMVVDSVSINGFVASASMSEVHILPGRGWQHCASNGAALK